LDFLRRELSQLSVPGVRAFENRLKDDRSPTMVRKVLRSLRTPNSTNKVRDLHSVIMKTPGTQPQEFVGFAALSFEPEEPRRPWDCP